MIEFLLVSWKFLLMILVKMEKLDFYLDINHGEPMKGILEEVRKRNKQIFTFENTNHDSTGTSKVFLANEPETMVVAIREFLGKGTS